MHTKEQRTTPLHHMHMLLQLAVPQILANTSTYAAALDRQCLDAANDGAHGCEQWGLE